ncbi:phage integrase SAM-like domain-containing protein [Mucilaginibacter lappiensis]|uniref:Phage integrase SAM-like domain-containing protein n=1 Tax=Mucilaginibacter lappiensis TaxID=354630 RepID=A0A841JS43_9SPHI|nr:phage integrase SAM-like domain-containing protein [Mucilaginibacter lappiensis]MBB6130671.1 hypothetical protein [Mucilaginibacter lappiensis]
MATLSPKVFKHHKRSDETYNVKICISHKSERAYLDTEHYVSEKKLSKSLKIKDLFISKLLNETLDDYREEFSKLGKKLALYTVNDLKDHLLKSDEAIDFLKFCQLHIDQLKVNGQTRSASSYNTVKNSLEDFFKRKAVPVEEITVRTLYAYERYLRAIEKWKGRISSVKLIPSKLKEYQMLACITISGTLDGCFLRRCPTTINRLWA